MDKRCTVFKNGYIITMWEECPAAESFAVSSGKILTVGKENEVMETVTRQFDNSDINIYDLQGATVTPGFIDTHLHPGAYIFFKLQLNLSDVKGFNELEQKLKEADRKLPEGEWIFGVDLMEDRFTDPRERKLPTRYDLDNMLDNSERGIVLMRHDGHVICTNSAVLKALNIDTAEPYEGPEEEFIGRDENGIPTGIFREGARNLILNAIPIPSLQRFENAAREFAAELCSFGITSFGAIVQLGSEGVGGELGAVEFPLLRTLVEKGVIPHNIVFYFITDRVRKLKRYGRILNKMGAGRRCGILKMGGIKLFADGSFGARTAWMYEPFTDGKNGGPVTPPERLKEIAAEAYGNGYDVITHAIGDRANYEVARIYSEIRGELGGGQEDGPILRIEHASVLTDETLDLCAHYKIYLSCQPPFIESEYNWVPKLLGEKRTKRTYPFATIISRGILLAAASDAPVESASVIRGIYACIDRYGMAPEEKIGFMDALAMYTVNAARACGLATKGILAPDKDADFVIIEGLKDVEKFPEPEKVKVVATYICGEKVFGAEDYPE